MAWRAMLVCPTASVRHEGKRARPAGVFPQELAPGVYRCGYNSEDSYGAHSYFVRRPEGNLLVDSPRYARELVDFFRAAGGISDVLLSHRDDVADADKYAKDFGARVWIHRDDARAAPYATNRLTALTAIRDGLLAIPVPGHTRGSVVYLLEDAYLFTGDSLAWSEERQDLSRFAMRAGIRGKRSRHRWPGSRPTASNGCCRGTAGACGCRPRT
jgi:glyoxylase-like metal-dependent hydrolase (beta-lactamase superfamily II)